MVSRLDLDGTYSPTGLVSKILKAKPNLKIPIPIEELCYELDIGEINELTTEGFEGGLLTDEARSFGGILVRKGVSEPRRRFTIAHELGHFLMAHHKPIQDGKFLCDRKAMLQWDIKDKNRLAKMEVEANQFAALLLMPPPYLRKLINSERFASLSTVLAIHQKFNVSKEAAARAYTEYSSETVAIIITKDQKYIGSYRNREFPWISLRRNDSIPACSKLFSYDGSGPSRSDETQAEYWIDSQPGSKIPPMYEQVMHQARGFAMIQLKILQQEEDDFDPEADMTAKQRYQKQQERWNR